MASTIRDEDFHIDVGRASEGKTFVRVIHVPTQASRGVVGLKGRRYEEVVQELLSAVLQEIKEVGWRRPEPRCEATAESNTRLDQRPE